MLFFLGLKDAFYRHNEHAHGYLRPDRISAQFMDGQQIWEKKRIARGQAAHHENSTQV